MKFKSYPKIHRLGKEETDDILLGKVAIQEKIDGANVSMWLDGDAVRCGTRTRELPLDESFNGFQEAVRQNDKIRLWLQANPTKRLYGEWLVRHTIHYPETAYKKIYLFDVYDDTTNEYWTQEDVKCVAQALGLEYPQLFADSVTVTPENIMEHVGKSFIGENGEGVVIKPENFTNKFGEAVYAKVVHPKFQENNAVTFGGNNKHSPTYKEMYIVNKYCTLARVQKIMQKLQNVTERRLDMEHTRQVAGTCYHDMITEEIWEIIKKIKVIDFNTLQRLATKKFVQIYHDILRDSVSVADGGEK